MSLNYWITHEVETPDGTRLRCYSGHDYQSYYDANGEWYMIDGLGYSVRSSVNVVEPKNLSVMSSDPIEVKRFATFWGTYGINQDFADPEYISPAIMTTDHIEAIIRTQRLSDPIKETFLQELEYRKNQIKEGTWVEPLGIDETKIVKRLTK